MGTMKTPEFPKTLTKGSCSVTVYETPTKGYMGYTLAYYQNGQRKRETSADWLAVRTRANEVLDDLNEGRAVEAGAIKASERNDYLQAVEILKPTGQPLHVAASHYAKAVAILGSDLVIVAAQEYAKRRAGQVADKLVMEAVDEMLAEKEKLKRSDRHIQTLASHLKRFGDSVVMNIASVTGADIEQFLAGLKTGDRPVAPRTRDNFTGSIVNLFEWAKFKRYVPSDYDEHSRITHYSNGEDGLIEIYTPAEIEALLAAADAKLVPFLAVGAFVGLRSSEIMRLDWADVRMENGDPCIVVQQGKVKKRGKSRRIVPMSANLKAWLAPYAKTSGLLWPFHFTYLYDSLRELAAKAQAALRKADRTVKLEWKSNALRHSCISYRVALIKNLPQVALESGNSPQMIDSHYRELVTEQDAQRWFNIMPLPAMP
jgi:integrase